MAIQIECPGCKVILQVDDALAGKQGKCIHCGHRLTVPSPNKGSFGGVSQSLFEATPEAMVRELRLRDHSALLILFKPTAEGSYDLADVADADLKLIATEDLNASRFAQLAAGFTKRFAPRKKTPSVAGMTVEEQLFELKGDKLGMSLEDFKRKYHRDEEGGQKLPLCSDTAWGAAKATLHSEPWHRQAGIVTARVDLPSEDNSPTVAGVKTELLLYQFVDGKLFRIAASFPTDQFHLVKEAAIKKYGPVTRESQKPHQLVWENPVASVALMRGSVHPREASMLELVYRQLAELAATRAPTAASDI